MFVSIKLLWYKVLRLFNRIDSSVIPQNTNYCYQGISETYDGRKVRFCKYYKRLKNDNSVCYFVGFKGFDVCLYDQCKICNISIDEGDDLNA